MLSEILMLIILIWCSLIGLTCILCYLISIVALIISPFIEEP